MRYLFAILFFIPVFVNAQSVTNIFGDYNYKGRLGVGTSTPDFQFQVVDSGSGMMYGLKGPAYGSLWNMLYTDNSTYLYGVYPDSLSPRKFTLEIFTNKTAQGDSIFTTSTYNKIQTEGDMLIQTGNLTHFSYGNISSFGNQIINTSIGLNNLAVNIRDSSQTYTNTTSSYNLVSTGDITDSALGNIYKVAQGIISKASIIADTCTNRTLTTSDYISNTAGNYISNRIHMSNGFTTIQEVDTNSGGQSNSWIHNDSVASSCLTEYNSNNTKVSSSISCSKLDTFGNEPGVRWNENAKIETTVDPNGNLPFAKAYVIQYPHKKFYTETGTNGWTANGYSMSIGVNYDYTNGINPTEIIITQADSFFSFYNGTIRYSHPTAGLGKVLTSDAYGNASWQTPSGAGWGLTGNLGTNSSVNFIGTTDGQAFILQDSLNGNSINIGGSHGTTIKFSASNNVLLNLIGGDTAVYVSGSLRVFNNGNQPLYVSPTTQRVEVRGTFQYIDSNATYAAGKVLTSDATGNATWQNPVANGFSGSEPSSPYLGQFFLNNSTRKMEFWDGATWAVIVSIP